MSLLQWNEDLSVGVALIDDEHKVFIGHLNALFDAIQMRHGPAILKELFDKLIAYSLIHFEHEEEYMLATDYPHRSVHQKAHEELRGKLMSLDARATDHPTIGLSNETFAFLKGWLTNHLMTLDKEMGRHLQASGVK